MSEGPDFQKLYTTAAERHIDLGVQVIQLASEGRWFDLIESVADHLNAIDAVIDGDEELYEKAKMQARRADQTPWMEEAPVDPFKVMSALVALYDATHWPLLKDAVKAIGQLTSAS